MNAALVPIGVAVGLFVWLSARHGLRPGPIWRAGFPSSGLAGACLALLPAEYAVAEPRLPLVVGLLAATTLAGAWALIARDPAYQPKMRVQYRTSAFRWKEETLSDDSVLGRKLFSSRRSLTGGGVAGALALAGGTVATVLRSRQEPELAIAGLWIGGGLGVTVLATVVAYLVGALVGAALGLVLPAEAPLATYDPAPAPVPSLDEPPSEEVLGDPEKFEAEMRRRGLR